MRGDPPLEHLHVCKGVLSTPHARGSTPSLAGNHPALRVYPACAGIHPLITSCLWWITRLPRMRGDPPDPQQRKSFLAKSTPHARGSTLDLIHSVAQEYVYPACAGIHPSRIPLCVPF